MAKLTNYSKNKEWAYYDDGSMAHRHKLNPNAPDNPLNCHQGYYLVVDGKCSKCQKEAK